MVGKSPDDGRLSLLSTCLASESNLEKRNLMTSLSFSVFDKVDARNDVDVGVTSVLTSVLTTSKRASDVKNWFDRRQTARSWLVTVTGLPGEN